MAQESSQKETQREIALGDLISKSWQLFSKNIKLILTAVLIVSIPVRLISSFFTSRRIVEFSGEITDFNFDFNFGELLGQTMLIAILSIVGTTLITLVIAWIVKTKALGGQLDWQAALQKGLSRWLPAIGTSILMAIFLAVLFMLLIVPGVIYLVFWAFAIYVVILNDKSGMEALSYSKSIVKGKWLTVFLYCLVIGIMMAIVAGIINGIIGAAGSGTVVIFLQGVVGDITNAFFLIASVLLYLNLESLKLKRIS